MWTDVIRLMSRRVALVVTTPARVPCAGALAPSSKRYHNLARRILFSPARKYTDILGSRASIPRGIHHRLNSEQPVPVFERTGRIFRDKAGSAAATHIFIIAIRYRRSRPRC